MLRHCLCLIVVLCASSLWAGITVRVQNTPGGPQIHLNGKPIPPRFLWGSMNSGPVAIKPEWQEISFEIRPGQVDGTGTLHFRFNQTPGEVWIAEVRIQDAQTGADVLPPGSFATPEGLAANWSTWPLAEANTVGKWEIADGALHVTLSNPPGGAKWPDFHFHSHRSLTFAEGRTYRVSFRAKATPATTIRPQLYNVLGGVWTYMGGPPGPFLQQVALARDAGVNLVSFSAPSCWAEPEKPQDWRPLDQLCRQIIAVNPKVLLVPRVGADAPGWWLERHPNSRMVYDGDQVKLHSCVSDRVYRAEVCAHLEKLSRHLTETFPDHFAGIHPCGQNTGEWFYQDSWSRPLSGYDADTLVAFRAWLKARGVPDADAATVPTADERRAHPNGFLRDPAKERRLIDFARFQQQEMAEHVLAMAAACRRGTGGQKLVVFFYGYLFEFPPLQCGAPTCGHYALSTVLQGQDIDILCSPISYTDRDWLGTAPCMTAAESVMQAGILWLNEDDSRTFLDPRQQEHVQEGGLVDLLQTQQVMLRNTAQEALRGFGSWWMDLPAQGWFNDARIWEQMVRLHPVDEALAQRTKRFTPDIAAIIDEDSMCHLPGGSAAFARPLIYDARAALGRSGAPYGQYLLDDVLAGKVPAKLQFFLAAYALSPQERAQLAASRRSAGFQPARVWCYAPGVITPDRLDLAGIQEVTGFAARALPAATVAVTPTEVGKRAGLTEGWEAVNKWGPKVPIEPLFTVAATPEETWATYADGSPAVVVRRGQAGTDVFLGIPALTPELVRALAKLAGVHVFTEDNSAVWATERYLSIQAHQAGPVAISTGKPGPVRDALDGKALGTGPQVTVQFAQGETKVLEY
ncbi:beta-galactosidase [bacterium]|nr:beta-galactosidase [bacterium]